MTATDRYLVHAEHGEYSDWCYDPLGIFDTEAEAREFASRLRVRINEYGSIADWCEPRQTDTLEPLVAEEDGTYSYSGFGHGNDCTVFVTKFEGGMGHHPVMDRGGRMSATDTIRAMLDERGVEHEDRDDWGTWWSYNGTEACYVMSHGGIFFLNAKSVTPEQAIEATLGRGECHMRLVYEEEDADGFVWPDHYECSVCGANVNGIMPSYDTEVPPRFCPNCGRKVRA